MEPGTLRYRIAIEQKTISAPDAFGNRTETWATLTQVWASKEDSIGREMFAGQQVLAKAPTRFTIRYRAGINATMRIRCDGTLFDIVSVADPDGRKTTLIITTTRNA